MNTKAILEDWATDRDTTIATIKAALKRRSGKAWSVTGGKGTAWGWIEINAQPARRTWRHRLKAGACGDIPENYEEYDSGSRGGDMSPADRAELAELLGLDYAHCQGLNIPASMAYRREYIDRAEGRAPAAIAEPYWD
jgi:hypothetical protein